MEQSLHDISAANLLFGSGAFLSLALPQGWELSPGVARPEIAACHVRGDRRWVVSGDAWYVVQNPDLRVAVELAIAVRSSLKPAAGGEPIQVGGHPAEVRHWTARRGLLKRWTVYFSQVRWRCELTERAIVLTLSSRAPQDVFTDLVLGFGGIQCH